MAKRAFGRIYVADPRDRKFTIKRSKSMPVGRRMWNEGQWAGDQGSKPHCVGYGWAHALQALPFRQWLNPDGIYELARLVDEWPGEEYEGTSVRAGAKVLKSLGLIESYRWAEDLESVVETILSVGPVVVGTSWMAGMSKPDPKGFITATGENQGGHCYLLSGVDTRRGFLRIKNSWGTSWADEGHAYIRFDDFRTLLSDQGEACLAVERKAVP